MPYPEKFTGFQVNGPDTWLEFHKNEFDPKPFGDYDVDVQVECCGVCGSDVHTLSGGWGEQFWPLAVGHGTYSLFLLLLLLPPSLILRAVPSARFICNFSIEEKRNSDRLVQRLSARPSRSDPR